MDVREFYNEEDKKRGSIMACDRDGKQREFDLLTVSAVIVYKGEKSSITTPEQLQKVFAIEKKNAKHSPDHLRIIIN
jgi:hypothetical protein